MNRATKYQVLHLLLIASQARAHATSEMRPSTESETRFYLSTVIPAVDIVKNAMPTAPSGWVKASETALPDMLSRNKSQLKFRYLIVFKRITGVDEEEKRLKSAFTEKSRKHEEEARPAPSTVELTISFSS